MAEDDGDMRVLRRKKLQELKAKGLNPYEKYKFVRTHNTTQIKKDFASATSERSKEEVAVAGRIMG